MRFSEIIESSGKTILVYHGGGHPEPHNGMYFSTDPGFAEDYGKVYQYKIDLGKMFDSLDETLIEPMLPMYDPYHEVDVETIDEYMDSSSDTWEIIEQHLRDIKSMGYDSIRVFEGGIENYYIFDKNNITLLSQKR